MKVIWYVIPYELKDKFSCLLDKLIESDYSDEDYLDEFDGMFNIYRTGGDLNLIELYAEI